MNNGNVASGALLVVVGIWVMFQTLVGDLPARILSLKTAAEPSEPDREKLGDVGKELLPDYNPFGKLQRSEA